MVFTFKPYYMKEIFNTIRDQLVVFLRYTLRCVLFKRDCADLNAVPDLAPVICEKGHEHYAQQLEVYLSRPERIKGIAVTGPYASGKSTFLNTYQVHHPELKYINISLANFYDEDSKTDDENTSSDAQQRPTVERIERAVLKQLLYRESDIESRGSRFVRAPLTNPSRSLTIAVAFTIIIFGIALLFANLYGTKNILDWARINSTNFTDSTHPLYWFAAFMIAVPTLLLADLVRYARQIRISKINPVSGDIEVQGKSHDSVFNLYLEDILAYFGHAKIDVVIFEDLDRFECHRIFERLRELNKVLNDSNVVSRPIRFIYAISDDVFEGPDRTKFFDAIVPILPVVAGANAYPQFKQLLAKAGITIADNTSYWDDLCRTITLYIQEMRLLKSIVAEFLLYRKVLELNNTQGGETKLLAFIAYKNLYSDDFALCQEGKGSLVEQIQQKKTLLTLEHQRLEKQIFDLRQEEKETEADHLADQNELAELMLYRMNSYKVTGVDSSYHPLISIDSIPLYGVENPVEVVEKMFNAASRESLYGSVNGIVRNGGNYNGFRKWSAMLESAMPDYQTRLERLKNRNIDARQTRQKKIEQLQQEQQALSLLSLAQCLKRLLNQTTPTPTNDKPMLHAFLTAGFIDEDYGFYLSAHVEGHLTKQDMELLRALKGLTVFDQHYKSGNYKELITFINGEACASPAAYNLGLIEYLSDSHNADAIHFFIEILKHQFKDHSQGLERLAQPIWSEACFKSLIKHWPDVLSTLPNNQVLTTSETAVLLVRILLTIEEVREDDSIFIQSIIDACADMLEIVADSGNVSKALKLIAEANIKIEAVNILPNLYLVIREALNYQVLKLNSVTFIAAISAINDDDIITFPVPYNKLPITDTAFKSFLYSDTHEYARLIYSGEITEVPATVIASLLNNNFKSILTEKEKLSLIEGVDFEIEDLNIMDLSHCQLIALAKQFRIAPTWSNLLVLINFYKSVESGEENYKKFKESIDELKVTVLDFLQAQSTKAALCYKWEKLEPESVRDEFVSFIEPVEIDAESFAEYIEAVEYQYGPENIHGLREDQSSILLKRGLLLPSFELYQALRADQQNNAALALIQMNESIFFKLNIMEVDGSWLPELEFSHEDLLELIVSDSLSVIAKQALLEAHQAQFYEFIDPKKWLHLVLPVQKQEKIYGLTLIKKADLTEEIATNLGLIPEQLVLEPDVMKALLASKSISSDDKVRLLTGQIAHLKATIWSVINSWETKHDNLSTTSDGVLNGLLENNINYAFCCALVYHDLVSSFSVRRGRLYINYFKGV